MIEENTDVSIHHSIIQSGTVYIAMCYTPRGRQPVCASLTVNEPIGFGSFGRVYKARINQLNRVVALKQVLQKPCQMEDEVDIMCDIEEHCNIVRLLMYFHAQLGNPPQKHLLMALEYMPMTLLDYLEQHGQGSVPLVYVRILSYQLFRGLAFLHSLHICHQDIKPDNMLMDPSTMNLKLGDFGSSRFVGSKVFSPCACPRPYRAPELLANCSSYSTSVDIWSASCVLAEMLKGSLLFDHMEDDQKQMLQIVCMLGTSGLESAKYLMDATGITLVEIGTSTDWKLLLGVDLPPDLEDLLNSCLAYHPDNRIPPLYACAHASYDELRIMVAMKSRMPNGAHLPPLFNFSEQELNVDANLRLQLLPVYMDGRES
ncbi:protein kinase shaggy [Drosophila innubila]|uniref:protein kinase shaggy n=1 Tax=Drosophila innubila TaxID=198719 RepID=UPI00148E201A|nr:protein kinase shaggy [Drosophila innubila]